MTNAAEGKSRKPNMFFILLLLIAFSVATTFIALGQKDRSAAQGEQAVIAATAPAPTAAQP